MLYTTLFTAVLLACTALAQNELNGNVFTNVTLATNDECITVSHLQAFRSTMIQLDTESAKAAVLLLPRIPETYVNSPATCIPESLYDLYFEQMVELGKQDNLISDLKSLLAINSRSTRKRALSCTQIKDNIIKKARAFACSSAPHPATCENCASFGFFNVGVACVACAANQGRDSPFCCATAASAFFTFYTHECLNK